MSESISRQKKYIFSAGALIALCACAALAALFLAPRGETTNDAFISADFTTVAPRIPGEVSELFVDDNQSVHKGQLLARIDDRDYASAVVSAEASVSMAKAAIDSVSASIAQQQSVIDQATASLTASRAAFAFAQAEADRYSDLARHGAGSLQNAQQARARIDSARADVTRAEATVQAARQQVAVFRAEYAKADATLHHDEAMLETARLNLSWTRIESPIDGVIGQRSLRVGAYVTPGTPLLAVVPLQQAYVIANFQETQLASIRPGQAVDVRVDTLPGRVLRGTVDSLAPATGVTFAAIAPDNATGNFTKVVQRIPIKIVLRKGQPALNDLHVGMSVDATVHTDRVAAL